MAKLYTDDFFKARIDNILFYRYRDMMVARTISGFTKETRMNDPKYVNCSRSANEFGRVSALCKQLRFALNGILPKQNNLAVVNSLTKKMRQVLEFDTTNARGERQLSNALQAENGKQLLKDYEFNPDTAIVLEYLLTDNSLTVTPKDIKFPKGISHIGFRLHQLAFDFETGENALLNGEWVFGTEMMYLELPVLADANGVAFTILEAQFYGFVDGELVKIVADGGKGVLVVMAK